MYIPPSTLQPVNVVSSDNDVAETSPELQKLFSGLVSEYIVTHPGHSQYGKAGGGVSACGLAALNCARLVLGLHAAGVDTTQLVREIAKRRFLEDILRPCLSWSISSHLAVEDICKAPVFAKSLKAVASEFGQANYSFLRKLVEDLAKVTQKEGVSACAIITRPPEIVACFSIADATSPLFVIFDSHPRPGKHPHGAAFIFLRSVTSTARYLTELLPYDESLLREQDVQWQAQLLAQCSGDIFVASDVVLSGDQWAEAALEASLQTVGLQARVRELESKTRELEDDKKRLGKEISALEYDLLRMDDALHRERARAERYKTKVADREKSPWTHGGSPQPQPQHQGGYSFWRPVWDRFLPTGHPQPAWQTAGAAQNFTQKKDIPQQPQPPQQQKNDRQISSDVDMLAVELQLAFDEENQQLAEQFKNLQLVQPKFFDCGICFEKYQEDYVAVVHPCEHAYCRTCLGSYAVSKIDEHRYPILCPQCTANRDGDAPGEIDDEAIQKLGLTEEQYEIFVEMQMLKFSIMINCRKCLQSAFVDKAEYQESKIIKCPLNGCGYVWCKSCSQEVDPAGPEHSCDGSNELEHIMKQQGWKHCPGCQTPAEKISGCNHMSCMAPGCNTHFCYLCGQLVVRSALPREISAAKSDHYTRCTLF